MIIDSLSSTKWTNSSYREVKCIEPNDIQKIGKLALDIVSSEMVEWLQGNDVTFCRLCALRQACPELSLPCRHTMNDNFLLKATDLHERYLRVDHSSEVLITQTVNTVPNKQPSSNYTDIMDQFAPFASVAFRNPEVNNILQESLQRLRSTQKNSTNGMPPTMSLQGRFAVHPTNNVVLGGKQKTKRSYKCSICNQMGHNKATCPNIKGMNK